METCPTMSFKIHILDPHLNIFMEYIQSWTSWSLHCRSIEWKHEGWKQVRTNLYRWFALPQQISEDLSLPRNLVFLFNIISSHWIINVNLTMLRCNLLLNLLLKFYGKFYDGFKFFIYQFFVLLNSGFYSLV